MKDIQRVLDFFKDINRVPRRSGNRGPITEYFINWAKEEGFSYKTDKVSNVVIQVPGTTGYENAPTVVLQGHSDMVCEKDAGSKHDFTKDPITLKVEGEWMSAVETTLGADNGIALALAMDLATDQTISHPPLEILITSDEEIGLIGANNLESDFIQGRKLINIDSEDEGVFTIGCAGGADSHLFIPIQRESLAPGSQFFSITLGGLRGGHSGVDIDKHLGNALTMVPRILDGLKKIPFQLISLDGGSGATNAICRDAHGVIAIEGDYIPSLNEIVAEYSSIFKEECGAVETELIVCLEEVTLPLETMAFTKESQQNLIEGLLMLPHGVAGTSSEIEKLVETSANLAYVHTDKHEAQILTSQRSSIMSRLNQMSRKMEVLAKLMGGSCKTTNKYPSWKPNFHSELVEQCKGIYKEVNGVDPVIEVIHAGLECGLIGDTYPGMDMISIGPTIQFPHTPKERLNIPSLSPIRAFLVALLKELK